MVLRAVLAVLTLAGAVPFRVCTCGAAHVHISTPLPEPDESSLPESPALTDGDGRAGHDHDCPAARPRAAMTLAVAATVADLPDAAPLVLAGGGMEAVPTAPAQTNPEARSPDPPPDRPLCLTLCTLRN